ncbi:MAG: hypothetical protein FWE20_11990 [Defluviitaleaceae bacterium]|nr:hypothetical protein [Defluviitaleaceae bacterium]
MSTCNDIGISDNSAIMAPGAHMPMPAIIHPKNTKEWKEGREAEKGELPEFMDVRAGAGSAKEGEEVKITALVKGIADGNQITFYVRPQGQPANTNIPPLAELRATVEGGAAETGYAHKHPKGKELPEAEPRLYAVAHSAWCPPKSGGEWEVVLRRPEIAVIEVGKMASSGEGEEASFEASETVEYGKSFMVRVQTKEVEDGGLVTITAACRLIDFSESKSVEVKGGKAEAIFETASISRQTLELLEDGDDFALKCTAETADNRAKKDGGQIKVVFTYIMEFAQKSTANQDNVEFTLESTDGDYKQTHGIQEGDEQDEGYTEVVFTDVLPGKNYNLTYCYTGMEENYARFSDRPFHELDFKPQGRK